MRSTSPSGACGAIDSGRWWTSAPASPSPPAESRVCCTPRPASPPTTRVEVVLPDGTVATSDAELSSWLGHDVELRRASPDDQGTYEIAADFEHEDTSEWISWEGPQGSFHDSGRTMVSIASAASFRSWDERRFRINVIVDGGDEQAFVGQKVQLGATAVEVVKPIGRCVITTRPQPGGIERDLDVLRTINAELGGNLGVGALVLTPGRVSVGDEVTVA